MKASEFIIKLQDMNICKNCIQRKIWQEDIDNYDINPEEFDYFEPTCPCVYCTLNSIGY